MKKAPLNSPNISQKEIDSLEKELEELTKHAKETMTNGTTTIQVFKQWLYTKLSKVPRKEINHDWHVVKSFYDRTVERLNLQNHNSNEKNTKIHTLAKINAYLELAKSEIDFAQAWTYVNLADSLLPLVVNEQDLPICTLRFHLHDKQLPDRLRNSLLKDIQELMKKGKRGTPKNDKDQNIDKYNLSGEQEIRALFWNGLNRKIALRISLWSSVGLYLLTGLAIALFVAEYWYHPAKEFNTLIKYPFIAVSCLGFFGGGLSTFIKTREKVVNITSYETLKIHTILRMLLGASGAFVVYIASNWLGNEKIIELLNSNIYWFLGIGITAGFSEKLFVGTLEQMADKLSIIGNSDENGKSNKKDNE